jgi:hypothetical protein
LILARNVSHDKFQPPVRIATRRCSLSLAAHRIAFDEIALATLCHYASGATEYLSQLDRLLGKNPYSESQEKGSATWVQFIRLKKRLLE